MNGMNIRLNDLFCKYLENDISKSELAEFSGYIDDPVFADEIQDLLEKAFQDSNEMISISDTGRVRVLKNILGIDELKKGSKANKLWLNMASVAAAVIFVLAGIYFFKSTISKSNYNNDVAPGRMGATLTLSNGTTIKVGDALKGKLAEEAGVSVIKAENGQITYEIEEGVNDIRNRKMNTLSTAKGETFMVILPDHSKVWLNAASSLTYYANLMKNGRRSVELVGEGYFEVAKDKIHPFVVECKGQVVEVLGTHFNVNAYNDEPTISTTLLEGSVKVTSGQNHLMLEPGFQLINNGGKFKVLDANVETVTDWKNGEFNLEHLDFKSAMRKISRWYDVEVIYDNPMQENFEIVGWISRNKKLSEILMSIEALGKVNFRIKGKKVYVFR